MMFLRAKRSLSLLLLSSSFVACQGTRPSNLGIQGDGLADCPPKPNCLVTNASADADHRVDPLPLYKSPSDSISLLNEIVTAMPRTTVVDRKDNYLRVEFQSLLLRFVDDVEFYVPATADKVLMRSASRLGHSDLGANQKRLAAIREQYMARAR